ncbi:hypothetical protein RB597_008797 [Gaeumannomyces tritici]
MLSTYLPIKLQPSAPRNPLGVSAEQQRWMHVNMAGLRASWKKKPTCSDIYDLLRFYLGRNLLPAGFPDIFAVQPFSSGDFNVLFKVTLHHRAGDLRQQPFFAKYPSQFLVRVGLPIAPYYKIESEVATILFAHAHCVPTPRVLFFDSSAKNPLGLDCMFLEIAKGESVMETCKQARIRADGGPWDPRKTSGLTLRAAGQATAAMRPMWGQQFESYGSLYWNWETSEFYVGPMVDFVFAAVGSGLEKSPLLPGPFATPWEFFDAVAKGWGLAMLAQYRFHVDAEPVPMPEGCSDHAKVQAEALASQQGRIWERAGLLDVQSAMLREQVVPAIRAFASAHRRLELAIRAPDAKPRGPSMEEALRPRLWHHDCHRGNIIWDRQRDAITAILDWEMVKILPASLARVRIGCRGARLPKGERVWIPKIMGLPMSSILSPAVLGPDYGRNADERAHHRARMGAWAPKALLPDERAKADSGFPVLLMALERLAKSVGFWTEEERMAVSRAVLDFETETRAMEERAAALEDDGLFARLSRWLCSWW